MIVPKSVFAHYMVGLTLNQTTDQWKRDIRSASAASIDGFALNIGAADHFTFSSLHTAYEAASTFANFSLFLSFDFSASGPDGWTVDYIANLTNSFKDEPAQFKIDGKPLVSTFEGVDFRESWREVRKKVEGDIVFVPDWSSVGPEGVRERVGDIDGAFSFDAWPRPSQSQLTTFSDDGYLSALSSSSISPNSKTTSQNNNNKIYMMGISPYFYTRLSSYHKNWYSPSDTLWPTRLSQALSLNHASSGGGGGGAGAPDLLQIITWNDFAESHYISDLVPSQILSEAESYVNGFDHGGFRAVLPWYVAAYKLGKTTAEEGLADGEWPEEKLGDGVMVAWYRTTPVNVTAATDGKECGDGGTKWGQQGEKSAREAVERDVVNVLAIVRRDTQVVVSVESTGKRVVRQVKKMGGASFFQVGFEELGLGRGNKKGGKVRIEMNGEVREGREVRDECPASGVINFNAATVYIAKSTHPYTGNDDGGSASSGSAGSGSGSGSKDGKGDGDEDGDENAAMPGRSVGVTAALVAFLGFALFNL
ncbi:glycosyl hydrolase family 71-domain-containing protein [Pseudoneurospora amorphoporcata]|uniref:Glycosyl hydrolase family 71-domain-containing protein n=1 Tax=Pseudoneurospora amorphoporcata TaxID=241081 RepID=A0AAN6NVI0_9PEZI|nr:glycosyl hydrolase family 71-domain-containing protein [Pseudoneurospora amorphoporcata]